MSRTVLDLIGDVCPVPLMRTSETLARLPAGSELLVETDYPRAVTNITQWCFRHGQEYRILDYSRGIYRVIIQKSDPPSA